MGPKLKGSGGVPRERTDERRSPTASTRPTVLRLGKKATSDGIDHTVGRLSVTLTIGKDDVNHRLPVHETTSRDTTNVGINSSRTGTCRCHARGRIGRAIEHLSLDG